MNVTLVRKLSEAGIIRENTEVEAYYNGTDLSGNLMAKVSGTFYIRSVKIVGDHAVFGVQSTVDGHTQKIRSDNVLTIDGMSVERLAATHSIDTRGGNIAEGKRRGRKPKKRD